jgi:hypothetical protein
LDNLQQQKNLEIDLLKKDKEQLYIQLTDANKTIENKEMIINRLQNELNEANQKLSEKSDSRLE